MGPSKWTAALAALVIIAGCSSGVRASSTTAPRPAEVTRPNIVFILVDDLDYQSYLDAVRFPAMHNLLVAQGTSFSNYFVTDSLCCPSRAALLRGQYVHDTKVLSNVQPTGGFKRFYKLGDERSTIATWLHDSGYRTALIGKYLNDYPVGAGKHYVPPGWDDWVSPADGNPYAEYNYTLNDNGHLESHGAKPSDYFVDLITRKARAFITANAGKQPFFLYAAPYVPHQPATAAPRYENAFAGVRAPRPPSYNEADMSAEPEWLRSRPLVDAQHQQDLDGLYRRRLQSMLGIEDMLRTIVATLRRTNELNNTYIVFSSDNGFHLGEHRLPAGKQTAYDEDIHVPLVVRGPGVPVGRTVSSMVSEVDLAPTLADLAYVSAPDFVDGASFAADLHTEGQAVLPQEALIEHFATAADDVTGDSSSEEPDDDAHPPLAGAPTSGPSAPVTVPFGSVRIPSYHALRTPDYLYVVYGTGEKQLYDLRADPYELHNVISTAPPSVVELLASRLTALIHCHAATCRT